MKTKEEAAAEQTWNYPTQLPDATDAGKEGFYDGFLAGAEYADRWISVEDELPEEYKQVLIKYENGFVVGIYSTEKDYCNWFDYNEADCDFQIHGVTHWKPIAPPLIVKSTK